MSATVKRLKLNTGASIPQIGFGTWLAKPGEVEKAVSGRRWKTHMHIVQQHCRLKLPYGRATAISTVRTTIRTRQRLVEYSNHLRLHS